MEADFTAHGLVFSVNVTCRDAYPIVEAAELQIGGLRPEFVRKLTDELQRAARLADSPEGYHPWDWIMGREYTERAEYSASFALLPDDRYYTISVRVKK